MIDDLLTQAAAPTAESNLRLLVADFIKSLRDSAGRGDRTLVAKAETAVQDDPQSAFAFDAAGYATLTAAGSRWQAGRFAMPSLAELRQRVAGMTPRSTDAVGRLWILDGASPVTDIGSLQATASERALFQVASQFNCLESPGPYLNPVSDYFHDSTQGPRASISAFPATLLRHYAAPHPNGTRLVQAAGQQVDLLADVFKPRTSPVRNGYLTGPGGLGSQALVTALEANFDRIRVGVHEAAQVVLGYNWDGAVPDSGQRRITQVFTSTVAGGGYGGERTLALEFEPTCRLLQRAAYLGTLLTAVALGRTPVVLTLIGGGVFRNPIRLIWDAILWAFDQVQPLLWHSVDVVINGYNLSRLIEIQELLPEVTKRGGAILQFDQGGLVGIYR